MFFFLFKNIVIICFFFIINKTTYELLLGYIAPALQQDHMGIPPTSVEKQVLMFLWYMANKSSYRLLSRTFDVSQSTAHKCVHRVMREVATLANKLICWPSPAEQQEIADRIQTASRIPNCIGFIDGSHFRLKSAPDGDPDYTNRKGYHSLQAQIVVDDKLVITDVYVGWPGSAHDARVYRNSPLYNAMQAGGIDGDKFIIGDSAYPLSNHMVVPFRDNGHLTVDQRQYNTIVSSQRQAVERVFGHVKGRFRQLQIIESTDVAYICQMITAAFVLHNLCVIADDNIQEYLHMEDDPNGYPPVYRNMDNGLQRRNNIMQLLRN